MSTVAQVFVRKKINSKSLERFRTNRNFQNSGFELKTIQLALKAKEKLETKNNIGRKIKETERERVCERERERECVCV